MKYVTMFVALLALVVPATAQTFTARPAVSYLSPTELVDRTPDDGVIRFTVKRGGIAKGRTAKLCRDYRPAFLYVAASEACPTPAVVPPVVEEPPVVPVPVDVSATISGTGESFVQNDQAAIGFAGNGSIGTLKNAPVGFRTDAASGFLRLGWFGLRGSDFVLPDAAIGGPTATINGKLYSNLALRGFSQIPGRFVSPLHWQGSAAGIAFDSVMTLTGGELAHVVTIANTTPIPAQVGLLWATDPDQKGAAVTTNRVVARGAIEATFAGDAGVYYLASDDPAAYVAVSTWDRPMQVGTPLPVGTVRKADDVVQLAFPPVTVAAGQSITLRFRQGLR